MAERAVLNLARGRPYELSDLGNRFETINVRNKSQRVSQFIRKIMF